MIVLTIVKWLTDDHTDQGSTYESTIGIGYDHAYMIESLVHELGRYPLVKTITMHAQRPHPTTTRIQWDTPPLSLPPTQPQENAMTFEYVNDTTGEIIPAEVLLDMIRGVFTSNTLQYEWMTFTEKGDVLTLQWLHFNGAPERFVRKQVSA